LEYANTNYQAFALEFALQKRGKKQLSEKYRVFRPKMTTALGFNTSETYKEHLLVLKKLKEKLALDEMPNLWSSLVHMLVNRAFETSQREMEMVIYHHLSSHYRSQLFRFGKI